jgi:hypothetical protein
MEREIRYYNEAQRVKLEEEAIKGLLFDYYKENTKEMLYCKIQCDYDKNANLNSIFQVYTEKIYLIDLKKDKPNKYINIPANSKSVLNRLKTALKKIIRKEENK